MEQFRFRLHLYEIKLFNEYLDTTEDSPLLTLFGEKDLLIIYCILFRLYS